MQTINPIKSNSFPKIIQVSCRFKCLFKGQRKIFVYTLSQNCQKVIQNEGYLFGEFYKKQENALVLVCKFSCLILKSVIQFTLQEQKYTILFAKVIATEK